MKLTAKQASVLPDLLTGAAIVDVATKHKISRRTIQAWLSSNANGFTDQLQKAITERLETALEDNARELTELASISVQTLRRAMETASLDIAVQAARTVQSLLAKLAERKDKLNAGF